MKSLVTLHDPALPDALFRRLLRAVQALGEEGLRGTWQRTFWFPLGAKPSSVVEEAITALSHPVHRHWGCFEVPARAIGAEWWLSRMRTSHVAIDFHQDHDIVLAQRGGPMRHPVVSTVLFLNRCTGGLLAVTREAPNPRNPALAPSKHAFDLVTPKPNRLVSFDGRLTHGVLDAKNRIPGGRLPREKELRLAVAVNFWSKKPLGAQPFSEATVYSALAT